MEAKPLAVVSARPSSSLTRATKRVLRSTSVPTRVELALDEVSLPVARNQSLGNL